MSKYMALFYCILVLASEAKSQTKLLTAVELDKQKEYTNIFEAIRDKEKVYKLSLSQLTIEKLPDEIVQMKNLQQITITFIPTLDINDAIKKLITLPNVQSLALVGCNIKQLPSEIQEFKNLEFLGLGMNSNLDIENVLNKLSSIQTLKKLNLAFNNIKVIPSSIKELSNLEQLMLANNHSMNCSESFLNISKIPNLKYLGMASNSLSELPKEIELLKIETLDISVNMLDWDEILPKLEKLTSLKTIIAQGSFGMRLAQSKKVFSLNGIERLSMLKELYLSETFIKITEQDKSEVKAKLPNCKIIFD